jgi:hypothetical protein
MLDENLPTFFIKPQSDNSRHSTIFLGQGGHDLQPEYTLKRPDPNHIAAKNCYAIALYDSYNPEILFAEVLVQPEWTAPTLSQAETRANNGVTPSPVPVVPNSFVIQLYNPDQQVVVRHHAGSWNSSEKWEFEMPSVTFRQPSVAALDRIQSDPAALDVTPKISFKWKRDGKLSKDLTLFLAGKSTEGKKSREPDITVAMCRHGKQVTVYEPNMQRVEVEDLKGLEVVMLLGAMVIRDIFFNVSREMFNISSSPPATRTNSSGAVPIPATNGRPSASSSSAANVTMAGALPIPATSSVLATPSGPAIPPPKPTRPPQPEVDAATAALVAQLAAEEQERERQFQKEQKRIKKMLEEEERARRKRELEVERETERLRREYGLQGQGQGQGQQAHAPLMPPRPSTGPRPSSSPGEYPPPPAQQQSSSPSNGHSSWWSGHGRRRDGSSGGNGNGRQDGGANNSPYLAPPAGMGGSGPNAASLSAFFGGNTRDRDERRRLLGLGGTHDDGGRKGKVVKKRSVYF